MRKTEIVEKIALLIDNERFEQALEHMKKYSWSLSDEDVTNIIQDSVASIFGDIKTMWFQCAFFELAFEIHLKCGDFYELARCKMQLGNSYKTLTIGAEADNQIKALQAYEEAIRYFEDGGYQDDAAKCKINLAVLYGKMESGNIIKNQLTGINLLHETIKYFSDDGDDYRVANCKMNLGTAYCELLSGSKEENRQKAIIAYQEAIQIYGQYESFEDIAQCTMNLGSVYGELNSGNKIENQKTALAMYQEVLSFYEENDDAYSAARCKMNLGRLHHEFVGKESRKVHQLQALQFYREAIDQFEIVGDLLREAKCRRNLGVLYSELHIGNKSENQQQALALLLRTQELFSEIGFFEGIGSIKIDLGNLYCELLKGNKADNQRLAEDYYQQSKNFFLQACDEVMVGKCLMNLAALYSELILDNKASNQLKSLELYHQAMQKFESSGNVLELAGCHQNLGALYNELLIGNTEENQLKSKLAQEKAILHFESIGNSYQVASCKRNLGILYNNLVTGDKFTNQIQALSLNEEAITLFTQYGDQYEVARCLLNQGGLYSALLEGDKEKHQLRALKAYQKVVTYFQEQGDLEGIAKCKQNMGALYVKLSFGETSKNQQKAINLYEEVVSYFIQAGDNFGLASCKKNIGLLYSELITGDREKNQLMAFDAFMDALNDYTYPERTLDIGKQINKLHIPLSLKRTGLLKATHNLEKYRQLLSFPSDKIALIEQTHALFELTIHSMVDEHDPKSLEELSKVIELSHQRVFLDQLKGGRIQLHKNAVDSEYAKNLLEELSGIQMELSNWLHELAKLFNTEQTPEIYGLSKTVSFLFTPHEIQENISRLQVKYQDTVNLLYQNEPRIKQRLETQRGSVYETNTLKSIMKSSKSLVVQYYLDSTLLIILSHDASGIQAHFETSQSCILDLHDTLEQYQKFLKLNAFEIISSVNSFQVSSQNETFFDESILTEDALNARLKEVFSNLYTLLLPPNISFHEEYEKIIFVPYGPLANVTFQALFDGNHHLIQNLPVSKMPTLTTWVHLEANSHKPNPEKQASAWMISHYVSPYPTLFHIEKEYTGIAEKLRLNESNMVLDTMADEQALLSFISTAKDILHLSGHAQLYSDLQEAALIACDGDKNKFITLRKMFSEFPSMPRGFHLVSLAMCYGAAQIKSSSKELIGLIPLFFSLGASACIASLTPLIDDVSADFFAQYYYHLNIQNEDPHFSFQKAILEMQDPDSGYSLGQWAFIEFFG